MSSENASPTHERKKLAVVNAPRCQLTKPDGTGCGSPAMKNRAFCYFHSRTPDGRKRNGSYKAEVASCEVPVLNNDHAVRVAVANVCRCVANKTLDSKRAKTLFYGLQIASTALRGRRSGVTRKGGEPNMY